MRVSILVALVFGYMFAIGNSAFGSDEMNSTYESEGGDGEVPPPEDFPPGDEMPPSEEAPYPEDGEEVPPPADTDGGAPIEESYDMQESDPMGDDLDSTMGQQESMNDKQSKDMDTSSTSEVVQLSNEQIKKLQSALKVKADGVIGPMTRKALIAFQKSQKLKATGQTDRTTLVKLGIL
jgi:hypothetical protein